MKACLEIKPSINEPIINSYLLSRLAIAFIWLYHGLVPKLIFRHATEIELIEKGPMIGSAETMLLLAGVGEVVLGALVLVLWRKSWPIYLSLVAFAMLLMGALTTAPEQAVHAFNPVTLTVSAIMFCLIQIAETKTVDRS